MNERACTLGKSCISPQNDKQTVTIRLTVRCKCRARNYKRRSRSREPSRIQVKKYVQILRKRKHRRKVKKIVKKSIPPSYFFKNTLLRDRKKVKSKSFCFDNIKVNNSNVYANCSEQYCVSKTKLLLSNDVETNPGPNEHNLNNPVNVTFVPDPVNLLEQRFNRLGMRPLDVGGRGDCFFRAVSHQLYGHPNNHWNIRVSGVEYMRENPERFIESNIESCWCDYLSSMSRNGTWADGLVIQAVADKLNLAINIIESNPYFSEFTLIQPVNPNQKVRVIYIGHMDEYHYVSSVSLDLSQQRNEYFKNYQRLKRKQINQKKLEKACNNSGKCIQRNRNDYFREYRKRRRLENEIQNKKETNKNSECSSTLENCKQKENDDVLVTEIFESHKSKRWSNHKYSEKAVDNLIAKFHVAISRGPLYICSCCDQLWYKHSVISTERLRLSNHDVIKYLLCKTSVDNVEWICHSCYKYLKKSKLPPCAVKNGMSFPVKPDFFDLNELECRLLAHRLAFQKLMQAPKGKQLKIKINVVNVPADVNSTVNMLPRLPQETGTIKIQLKRGLQYKSSALSLNVTPYKVLQAAKWLVSNSTLYREQGVTVS